MVQEEGRLNTCESLFRTVVDYILTRKTERELIRDVKVIWQEPSITAQLLACVLDQKEGVNQDSLFLVHN